jgi:predicted RNA-binding protein with PUA-like domain
MFVLKTEPSTYSFADLERDSRTVWDGVSNPVALKHLGAIRKGDTIAIYHTGDEKQVVGLATAASDAYADPKLDDARRVVVDLKAGKPLPTPVTLAQVKTDAVLKTTDLARLPRLSVIPFSAAQWKRLLELAGA